ncbi:GntR family transcriptional regulator [Cellulomonas sp. C5510]|uniref:GntR family transcriptional regulator n=1 Tax=Cellulomonas sp. C5510 TaxID=2871170 RepID=UPI001C96819F|nr:GntR family transcriptional regulator [Cellulomonas sp. C5510]QZN85371.1 GntR family transcriptional regulator [Cellulomonas sp. C5510]
MTATAAAARRHGGTSRLAVYEELRRRVVGLELPPGAPLSENELAAELGVSRTPVREALIMLAQDDLVQVFPKIGSFVARVDAGRVADAQFVREAVELASLDDVPTEPDPALVAVLRANLVEQERAESDPQAFFVLDEEFHQGLLRLAGHEGTWPAVVSAKAHLDRARRLGIHERSLHRFTQEHAGVLDALLTGGADAARPLMRAHLRTVFDDITHVRRRMPELFEPARGRPVRRTVAVWLDDPADAPAPRLS